MALSRYGQADKIYDDGTGLLSSVVRRYKVDGQHTTVAQLPTAVVLGYETPDEEHSDCLLAHQSVKTREGADAQESILTRVYVQIPADAATLVQMGNDLVTYSENGLKMVEQRFFGKRTHALAGTVGTTAGGSGDINTLILSSNGFAERGKVLAIVVKRWAEAGILNRSEDLVGSQKAITLQTIGADPSTPAGGYSLARKSEGNYQGFQTNDFTFLKNNVRLSVSEDLVGSQKAQTQQWFNPSSPKTLFGYSLARTQTSDFDGIETSSYTFLKPSVLSRNISTQNNGKLIIETVEAFNENPTATTAGAVQIGNQLSDVEGIQTRRFTFAKGEGQIRSSTQPGRVPGTTEVTVVSIGTKVIPTGSVIAESETESDGYITHSVTAVQGTIAGIKRTYQDVADVDVPGTVECSTESFSFPTSKDSTSGTIAITQVVPPSRKKITATVTIEVGPDALGTIDPAFDISQISCSVSSVKTNASVNNGTGGTFWRGVWHPGWSQNLDASARIQTYPGCYLTVTSSSGAILYQSFSAPTNETAGAGVRIDTGNSAQTTTCTGSGSTTLENYVETGLISRNSRPILVLTDGTTYYETITWSVS